MQDRMGYLLAMEGGLECAGGHSKETLSQHDAAELGAPDTLNITAGDEGAHFLLLEMAKA